MRWFHRIPAALVVAWLALSLVAAGCGLMPREEPLILVPLPPDPAPVPVPTPTPVPAPDPAPEPLVVEWPGMERLAAGQSLDEVKAILGDPYRPPLNVTDAPGLQVYSWRRQHGNGFVYLHLHFRDGALVGSDVPR